MDLLLHLLAEVLVYMCLYANGLFIISCRIFRNPTLQQMLFLRKKLRSVILQPRYTFFSSILHTPNEVGCKSGLLGSQRWAPVTEVVLLVSKSQEFIFAVCTVVPSYKNKYSCSTKFLITGINFFKRTLQ